MDTKVIRNRFAGKCTCCGTKVEAKAGIAYLEDKGQDCTACHLMTDDGLSETFLNVRNVAPGKQTDYLHATCTACHVKLAKGPRLVDCRVCHSERIASEYAAKK